jgi:uncharacterized protein (DUF1778 family)
MVSRARSNAYDLRMASSEVHPSRLEVLLPPEVHAALKRAAELRGCTLADYIVSVAYEAACRAAAEVDVVELEGEDQRRLAEAILDPPTPAKALERAARRRTNLIGS